MRILFKCTSADDVPVCISGNHPSLGQWDATRALPMQLENGGDGVRLWSAMLDLEPGSTIEYKFIKRNNDAVQWENGWNRNYTAIPGPSSISDSFRT